MIVDDEETIRTAISKMIDFNSLGYEVIATAKNGMEAFDIICDSYPDVVITDIKMPILNGLELIERANNLDVGIEYIILSGYGEFEFAKQAMKFGVHHFLLKPTNKQELIQALIEIHDSRMESRQKQQEQQKQILDTVRFPMEQCFLIEALEWQHDFLNSYQKYDQLLSFPENCLHACICSFVEETHLNAFIKDVQTLLKRQGINSLFPMVAVKNTVILILDVESLALQEALQEGIKQLKYPDQTVTFEVNFLHYHTTFELFQSIIQKIARFGQILCFDSSLNVYEIRNNLTSSWKLQELETVMKNATSDAELNDALQTTLANTESLDSAKKIAIELYLMLNNSGAENSLDMAFEFFGTVN